MIVGVGTDILSLARLQAFSSNRLARLSKRILTEKEWNLLQMHTVKSETTSPVDDSKVRLERTSRFLGVR